VFPTFYQFRYNFKLSEDTLALPNKNRSCQRDGYIVQEIFFNLLGNHVTSENLMKAIDLWGGGGRDVFFVHPLIRIPIKLAERSL
jgi:hypothetical protein